MAPEKTAMVDRGRRFTYRQVADCIKRVRAGLFLHWEMRPGAVVALLAPNCAEFVISYFALVNAGAIVQPLDERLAPEEIKSTLVNSGACYLIVHESLWPKFDKIRAELPSLKKTLGIGMTAGDGDLFDDWLTRPCLKFPSPDVTPGNIAELMYTSGTTGEPKGVMRSHANVLAASRNSIRGFGYRGSDVIAIVMPLSHSSALNSQMIPLLKLGGTVVLVNGFDVCRLLSVIEKEQVTCMRAVPTMMRMLLASPDFNSAALPSLRLLINSSAPIDPETYREVKRRFPSIELMNSYGLTEASTCTVLPDRMALSRAESIGHPIDGVEMCVRDEEGRILEDQCEGEIYVRGEHVFVGYHKLPDATRNALVDGWLRTGDFGHRDREGLYYLHGRKSDLINCGGRKFAPKEVESCILQMSEVFEVAVVGIPHRMLGEVAKAFVVASERNGVDAKRIMQHCAKHLPSYKLPFSVTFVSELPKSSTGKFLHRKLREIH
jgi:long-chain acyl-CoA synthetase